MKPSLLRPFLFLSAAALIADAGFAQATRTWVSGVGDDANPCSRTAPCKTFAGAISKTAANGEISVLDPGGFGVVTVTKSITINGDGTLAGILSAGTTGIIINAGPNDQVIIRNISINGAGTGLNGIRYLAGKSVTVENVTINGFTTRGIDMSLTTNGKLFVRNTSITSKGGGTGIFITTTSGQAQATLDGVNLHDLNNGIEAAANGRAVITNSSISNNSANGVLASASTSRVALDSSEVAFNDLTGVNAAANGAIVRIAGNQIYNNNAGVSITAGATVESDGRNRVAGNVSSAAPNAVMTVQ